MTIFSTGEEQALEGPNGLGGNVQYYPVSALAEAGARVGSIANWHPNVVVDRELIAGQQPMSAPAFGDALVAKLNERAAKQRVQHWRCHDPMGRPARGILSRSRRLGCPHTDQAALRRTA